MSTMLDTNALAETAGPFKTFFERLAGPEGSQWLEAFKRFLRREDPWPEVTVWKTLTLGLHESSKDYRNALESAGFRIGGCAGQILNKISVAKTQTEIDLVLVTVAELGFKDGACREVIYTRALGLGLELCPSEVGPALRLVYKEDPWVIVGMGPITDLNGRMGVLGVGGINGDRWLRSDYGEFDSFWRGSDQWVFIRPRK